MLKMTFLFQPFTACVDYNQIHVISEWATKINMDAFPRFWGILPWVGTLFSGSFYSTDKVCKIWIDIRYLHKFWATKHNGYLAPRFFVFKIPICSLWSIWNTLSFNLTGTMTLLALKTHSLSMLSWSLTLAYGTNSADRGNSLPLSKQS